MVSRLSLLERKQLQWQKEREDLQAFGGLWGGVWTTQEKRYRPCIRSQFKSSLDLPVYREEEPQLKRRTPSLPPIGNNYEGEEEGGGEDTSGYASDSAAPEYHASSEPWPKSPAWPLPHFTRRTPDSISSGSGREERAKWGDRGVGVGHLWEPSASLPPPPLPRIQPATPAWIQRGLQEPPQVLVISHNEEGMSATPSSSQGTSRSCDTPLSSEGSQRSYIRGQNIPLEPSEIEERERKRQKALEHQNAIKKQIMYMVCVRILIKLEEKEKKKKEEQERLEREERLAEERLRKQQELERQRLEEERRRLREKEEKDERIAAAMREALEAAEKAAREEKAKARRKHIRPPTPLPPPPPAQEEELEEEEPVRMQATPSKEEPLGRQESPRREDNSRRQETPRTLASPRRQETPRMLVSPSRQEAPRREEVPTFLETPARTPRRNESPKETKTGKPTLPVPKIDFSQDLPPPFMEDSPETERRLEEEVELSVRLEQLEIEAQNLRVVAEPGRILTPSKYRATRAVERSTQTDINASRTKTTKRYLRTEERPKWGVNRPLNQYIKASDRDPFRRSRPLRTSPRDSSSRSPSPLDESKASFKSTGSLGKSNATYTLTGSRKAGRVTRGVCTPRVMQVVPAGGIIRKSSAGARIISIKGSIGLNGGRRLNRPQQTNLLPKKLEVAEFLTVNQVLTQLMDLKQGLKMKQKEWEITRSPTPFSEISYQ